MKPVHFSQVLTFALLGLFCSACSSGSVEPGDQSEELTPEPDGGQDGDFGADANADASDLGLEPDPGADGDATQDLTGDPGTEQNILYAAPEGSGSVCSLQAPCSLIGARDKARSQNSNLTSDLLVNLRGGTYLQDSAFELDARDSGSNGYVVIYRAFAGETPILSGGRRISGWTHVANSNLWQAPVDPSVQTRQLYIHGRRRPRAHSDQGILGTVTKVLTGYVTTDSSLRSFRNPSDLEFVYTGAPSAGSPWTQSRCGVQSIGQSNGQTVISMKEPCWTNATVNKCCNQFITFPTQVENALELLDTPGEWYLDRSAGLIYYYPFPGEDLSTAEVVAPVLENLLHANGTLDNPVHHIVFSGITFTYGTWLQPSGNDGFVELQANYLLAGSPPRYGFGPGSVTLHAARQVRFENNVFCHLGAQGLVLDLASQDNRILGNVFFDISGTAVRIGDVSSPDAVGVAQDRGNQVSNNYITDVGVEYPGGPGLLGGYLSDTRFVHNELSNLPYSGISLGWGWGRASYAKNNEVGFNHIHHHMQLLSDGGGVYTLSDQGVSPTEGRSSVHDNYIHHAGHVAGALYPDEGSAYFDLYRNVLASVPLWVNIWINTIHDITVYDNFSDTAALVNNGTNITMTNNYTGGLPWPDTALAIIRQAGLEPSYRALLGKVPRNLALSQTASSSSVYSAAYNESQANDGEPASGWSPAASDARPWWQVDLGQASYLSLIELVTRQELDQPATRQQFEIRASNDPSFASFTVLGGHAAPALPHQSTWVLALDSLTPYRYVRASKSQDGYFFIAELRVWGKIQAP